MGAKTTLWCVKRIGLFREVTEEELKQIASMSDMLTLRRGQQIFIQGDPGGYVYCLASGWVKISRSCLDGRELIVDIIMPGEIFGEILGGGETVQDTIAEAMDDVLLCLIPRKRFEGALRVNPELSFRLIDLIGLRLRWMESRIADLVCKDVQARLATLLLHLARQHGTRDSRGVLLRPHITQQQLAGLVGASRGMVNQALGDFRRKGLIAIEGRRIIIHDQNALASLT